MTIKKSCVTIGNATKAEVNETIDKAKRYNQIISILKDRELTAKEIAVIMYKKYYIPTTERNFTAPRLTELLQMGVVEIVGKKKCEYTGKTVSIYRLLES